MSLVPRPLQRVCVRVALLVGLGSVPLLLATPARARDDVPADVAALANPVVLDAGEVSYYERHYKSKCARCHGLDGRGKGAEGRDQRVPPADFTAARAMQARSDGQLFYQILKGGGERCAMPAFGPESDTAWSEERIWHMVAFIRRFAQPAEPAPDKP
jgi:mono/diheme cytochrome c family protein